MKFTFLFIVLFILILHQDNLAQTNSNYLQARKLYRTYPDSALLYIQKCFNELPEDSIYQQAKAYLLTGVIYKNKAVIDRSFSSYYKAEKLFSKIQDTIGIASVQNNLARLFIQIGKPDKGLQAFFKSLKLFEQKEDSANIAEVSINLAELYVELKESDKAILYLNNAKKIFSQKNNKVGIAFILTSIGDIQNNKNNKDKALNYYFQSAGILKKTYRKDLLADMYVKIAEIKNFDKKYAEALKYLNLSEKIYSKQKISLGLAKVYFGKGNIQYGQSAYLKAIEYYHHALKYAQQNNATNLILELQYNLFKAYQKQNKYKKALLYYQQYVSIKDSVAGIEIQNNIAKIQAQYKLLLHQNQIKSLKDSVSIQKLRTKTLKLISQRRKYDIIALIFGILVFIVIAFIYIKKNREKTILNKKLSEALNDKEILLKELHHRVKNNLQIISSLLNLQQKFSGKKTVDEILQMSKNRIDTMVSVHEKLYQSKNFKDVRVKEYTEELVNNIANSFDTKEKQVKIKLNSDKIKLSINQMIPYGLIINELITNSYKHAFKKMNTGIIELDISEKNSIIFVDVKDNGVGMPDNFEISQSNTLGMKLIKGLSNQLKGNFTVLESEKGTHFKISFKKEQ